MRAINIVTGVCTVGVLVWQGMSKLDELKRHLKPGQAYRRADLARWSTSVDRHLKQLVEQMTMRARS
ncbi:hypothetical protein FXB38_34340 [Bradyrhizobium cytisi]|uniref:Uncharacterized protein n=1 Tax=Bradyrhizobium cytisi TaxID=515489 RepID=A0A5S4W1W5_9BRAD|nr:hypothetical protein FXB38_34340 [Bradyrhizobium cytisi]